MIIDLKPYPKMKDSGVEWLGKVPEHWKIKRLKSSVNNVIQQTIDHQKSDLYVAMEHVESWTGRLILSGTGVSFDSQLKRFRPGDVLFGKLRPYLAKVTRPLSYGVCVGEFLVLRPRNSRVTSPFLEQMLRSKPFIDAVNSSTFGAKMPRADWLFIGGMAFGRPPLSEQAAMVRFLGHTDRRIRRYIRAKQKLIALLEEQKQAIIHQAVTGQIDVRTNRPYPAYKPSGVDWLGDVPAHWEVRRSKRTFTPRQELASPEDVQLSATQAYGVIAQEDYEKRVGRKVVKILRHLEQRRHVEVDDFVISMRSFQGGLERAWQSGCIRSSYIVLQAATELVVGYFGQLFKSIRYIAALQSTANFIRDGQDLNFENFCWVDLPFPPKREQQLIAATLERVTMGIGSAIERSSREIDLLREYRNRLIADVVTGKLDVREAAARLPEADPLGDEDVVETVHTDVDSNLEERKAAQEVGL